MVFDADPALRREPLPPTEPQRAGLITDISERCRALGITEVRFGPAFTPNGLGILEFKSTTTDRSIPPSSTETVYFVNDLYQHLAYTVAIDYLAFLREQGITEQMAVSPWEAHQNTSGHVLPLKTARGTFGEVELSNGGLSLEQLKPMNEDEEKFVGLLAIAKTLDELDLSQADELSKIDKEMESIEILLEKYAKRFGEGNPWLGIKF